ncbi:MAG: hypothetical protein CMO01_14510 [Thalassobius sp.]|nr:hypothetical protein [Thalassovita sp.]
MRLLNTIGLLLSLLVACTPSHKNTEIVETKAIHLDLTQDFDDAPLQLDKYLDEFKLIQLETNPDNLLSYFRGYIGDKNIIAFSQEKIMWFSADGKYKRAIAIKGKGPDEFKQIDAWAVDDEEQYFLYHDRERDYIYKFDLATGTFVDEIPFEDKGYLSSMLIVNDTTLAFMPSQFATYGYLYFYQNTDGKVFNGVEKTDKPHPGAWAGTDQYFKQLNDYSILLQKSDTDTIYQVQGGEMQPYIYLGLEEQKISGYKTTGYAASPIYIKNEKFFFNKYSFEKEISPNNASMSINNNHYLIFDKKDQSIESFGKAYFNYYGLKIPISYFSFTNDGHLINFIQAYKLKTLIDETLKEGELSEAQKSFLVDLNSKIKDDDNPILITGKINLQNI